MSAAKPAWKTYLIPALLAVIVAVLALAIIRQQDTTSATPEAGRLVNASLPQLSGDTLNLADYQGKIVVVNFLAAWCTPCWNELKYFERISNEYASRGVAVVGIAVQSSPQDVRRMIDQIGVTFPVGLDENGQVSQDAFRLQAMPTTLFFDEQGRVIDTVRGEISEADLRAKVEALL